MKRKKIGNHNFVEWNYNYFSFSFPPLMSYRKFSFIIVLCLPWHILLPCRNCYNTFHKNSYSNYVDICGNVLTKSFYLFYLFISKLNLSTLRNLIPAPSVWLTSAVVLQKESLEKYKSIKVFPTNFHRIANFHFPKNV